MRHESGNKRESKKKGGVGKMFGVLLRQLGLKGIIILAVLFFLGGGLAGVATKLYLNGKTAKIGFENIGELATQEAYCTQIGEIEKSRELFDKYDIPFTQSKVIYSYDVVIKAGYDFGEIDWGVKGKTIHVKLPEAKILSCEVDTGSFQLYHESRSVFTPITMEDQNKSMKELQEKAQEDAIQKGLLDNAEENAKVVLRGFFAKEYDMNTYDIVYDG